MKKVLKALGISILYILLYLTIQTAVLLPPALIYVIKLVANKGLEYSDIQALMNQVYLYLQKITNLSMILSALLTLGVLYLIFIIRKKNFFQKIQLHRVSAKSIVYAMVLGVSMNIFVSAVLSLLPIPSRFFEGMKRMSEIMNSGNIAVDIIALAIAAPLVEEIIFRGCVFTTLKRNMWLPAAAILQAVLFGILHGSWISFGYATVLGIMMAWVFTACRSILASIALHVSFNAASFAERFVPNANNSMLYVLLILTAILAAASIAFIIAEQNEKHRDGMLRTR